MEGARVCAVQRSRRGKRSVYAAKGPCNRARGATVRNRGRPTNDGAQMSVRRGGSGPCASARGPSHAPAGRAGRRRISDGNHRCVAHSAYVEFNRPSDSSWASFASLARACHQARTGHRLAVGMIDKVTTCHQAIGCSDGTGGNFHLTEDPQYLRRQHGNRVRDGQGWLAGQWGEPTSSS